MKFSIRLKSFLIIGVLLSTTLSVAVTAAIGGAETSEIATRLESRTQLASDIGTLRIINRDARLTRNLLSAGLEASKGLDLAILEPKIRDLMAKVADSPPLSATERGAVAAAQALFAEMSACSRKAIATADEARAASIALVEKAIPDFEAALKRLRENETAQSPPLSSAFESLAADLTAITSQFLLSQSRARKEAREPLLQKLRGGRAHFATLSAQTTDTAAKAQITKLTELQVALLAGAERQFGLLAESERLLSVEMAEHARNFDQQLNSLRESSESAMAAMSKDLRTSAAALSSTMVIAGIIAIVVGVIGLLLFSQTILKPLIRSIVAMENLSQGDADLTKRLAESGDLELIRLAAAFNRFVANIAEEMRQITGHSQKLTGIVSNVSKLGNRLTEASDSTKSRANAASHQAGEVDVSMQSISAAIEEMSASISEIAGHSSNSQDLSHRVASMANDASAQIRRLGASSTEIGEVVRVITSIAEQTNLLALNATIESARAGDAGKGFAVVANEVKELAKSTAEATGDIGRKVEAIQADTQGAIAVIERIAGMIDQVTEAATTIAAAVQEQSATSSEISQSVHRAAQGTNGILADTREVTEAADQASQCRDDLLVAARELAGSSSALQSVVGRYRL